MASNKIPESPDPLCELGEDCADGAAVHAATIGIATTEADIRTPLENVVGREEGPGGVPPAEPGLRVEWNAAKANKTAKTGLFQSAKSNGRAQASACMGVLKPRLGNAWSSQWVAAGFIGGSLAIPSNPLATLQQLRGYFLNNPTHEVPGLLPYPATAAACHAAAQAISTAATASNQSNTDAGTAKAALAAGIAELRNVLGGLREQLGRKLSDDDERWYAFGFNKPSDPNTPEVPENLVAISGAAGTKMIFLDWDNARRATKYRVVVLDGAGAEIFNQIYEESEATVTLSALASGTQVTVKVTGRNSDGEESQASEPITATVP